MTSHLYRKFLQIKIQNKYKQIKKSKSNTNLINK